MDEDGAHRPAFAERLARQGAAELKCHARSLHEGWSAVK